MEMSEQNEYNKKNRNYNNQLFIVNIGIFSINKQIVNIGI